MARPVAPFVSIFSHELRTRMNAVMGLTELCLEMDLQPDQREVMQLIHGSTIELYHMMETMIDITTMKHLHAESGYDGSLLEGAGVMDDDALSTKRDSS